METMRIGNIVPAVVRRLGFAALAAVAGLACSDDDALESPSGPELETISLDVRVHLLSSSDHPRLDASLGVEDVSILFEGVNAVWETAGIEWNVESIVVETAQNGDIYDAMLDGAIPVSFAGLASVLPGDRLLGGQWNVFVINDLGDVGGGVYLGQMGSVIFAEFGPLGPQPTDGSGRRILAHELGHSLGLAHVPCISAGNLMSPNCPAQDRTRLTPDQVAAARAQARRGHPFGL